MRLSLIIAVIATGTLLCSCKHYCMSNPYPVVRLNNFDSADLNTVIFKTYTSNGEFTNPLSTTIYTSRWLGPAPADTQSFFTSNFSPQNAMNLDFNTDATVEIPAVGKTWYIKSVAIHYDTWKDVDCTNSMSYVLNDTPHTIPMQVGQQAMQGYIDINK